MTYLSALCYYRNKKWLKDKEFNLVKEDVIKVLENTDIKAYLKHLQTNGNPYSELCIWRKNEMNVKDEVKDKEGAELGHKI